LNRLVAVTSNGRFAAIRRQGHVAVIDAYGTEPERRV
jgi:hypothetical protein